MVPWRAHAIISHFSKPRLKHAVTIVSSVAVLFAYTGSAFADQYDSQISALKAQAAAQAAQAAAAQANVTTYQQQVAEYQAQANAIQAQINVDNAKIADLNTQISTAEANLQLQKTVLAANLKQMYLDSGVTPLEMLVSSNNISDYMDKQQYQDKVKQKIQDSMAGVVSLEGQLKNQQAQLSSAIKSSQDQAAQVTQLESQANALLAVAANDAAAANAQVQQANAQISSLKAQQAASFAKLYSSGGSSTSGSSGSLVYKNVSFGGTCGGGYPDSAVASGRVWGCDYSTDYNFPSSYDNWGMANRECVSYAAWAMSVRAGNMPYIGGKGMAYQWPASLASSFPENNDPNGSAVVMIIPQSMIGGVGHAAVVESVSNGWVHVSQYNWWPSASGPSGLYSTMDVKLVPGLVFIHFK